MFPSWRRTGTPATFSGPCPAFHRLAHFSLSRTHSFHSPASGKAAAVTVTVMVAVTVTATSGRGSAFRWEPPSGRSPREERLPLQGFSAKAKAAAGSAHSADPGASLPPQRPGGRGPRPVGRREGLTRGRKRGAAVGSRNRARRVPSMLTFAPFSRGR